MLLQDGIDHRKLFLDKSNIIIPLIFGALGVYSGNYFKYLKTIKIEILFTRYLMGKADIRSHQSVFKM